MPKTTPFPLAKATSEPQVCHPYIFTYFPFNSILSLMVACVSQRKRQLVFPNHQVFLYGMNQELVLKSIIKRTFGDFD